MSQKQNQKQILKSMLSSSLFSGLTLVALTFQAVGIPAYAEESARPDREAIHAAIEACASENNIAKPEQGQRPSEADRQVIDACMKAKGFSPPPQGRGRGPGGPGDRRGPPPKEQQGSTDSSSQVSQ